MAERGFPSFSGNASASTRALSLLTSSAAFSHESSSDMSRERKEEAKKNRGSFSCFTKEAKNKLFRTTLGSFGSSAFRENGRLAGTRSVLYSPRSGGLSVPVGVMVEEREATREAASRDGTKESRGERERESASSARAAQSAKDFCSVQFSFAQFPFFLPRSPRKFQCSERRENSFSLRAMEEPPRAADDGAVIFAAVNGSSETTATTERAAAETTTTTKDEAPSTSPRPMPLSPPPPQPSPPLPAPPGRAIRAHRRRGDNAGLHFIFCGGRIAIGAVVFFFFLGALDRSTLDVSFFSFFSFFSQPPSSLLPKPSPSTTRPRLEVPPGLRLPHRGPLGGLLRHRGTPHPCLADGDRRGAARLHRRLPADDRPARPRLRPAGPVPSGPPRRRRGGTSAPFARVGPLRPAVARLPEAAQPAGHRAAHGRRRLVQVVLDLLPPPAPEVLALRDLRQLRASVRPPLPLGGAVRRGEVFEVV